MDPSIEAAVQDLLRRRAENGGPFWSRADGNIHAPAGFSTIDVLNVLGQLGATVETHPDLGGAVELVLRYQTPEGAFRYSGARSQLPCIAGQVLAALGRLGLAEDARYAGGLRWLVDHQADDGGWRCATVERGKSPVTDASNPGATLFVLDGFRPALDRQAPAVHARLDRAVEFLLHHWETRAPLGPCLFGIGSRFLEVEFPFLRYNLFSYVYVLAHFERSSSDPRFLEALDALAAHVRDGEMVVDSPHRAWQAYDFARRGSPSALATQRWREIERLAPR